MDQATAATLPAAVAGPARRPTVVARDTAKWAALAMSQLDSYTSHLRVACGSQRHTNG